MRLSYFAAWTDSGCLLGCDHQHETVISATACISQPGGYVIAVENGELRALTDAEEAEFQYAMYGTGRFDTVVPMDAALLMMLEKLFDQNGDT